MVILVTGLQLQRTSEVLWEPKFMQPFMRSCLCFFSFVQVEYNLNSSILLRSFHPKSFNRKNECRGGKRSSLSNSLSLELRLIMRMVKRLPNEDESI